ncbi:MAG TPA: LPS assembly lipoprotein LptE [Rhizobacter sp.]|nr:LPS assembly lipoprotein LptE [Rhizobacter sp.]
MTSRRWFLLSLAALAGGCGFELRRAPELKFKTLYLSGFKMHAPLAAELRRSLLASTTTKVVEAASQAEVVLEALADARDKGVVASTTAGQVREVQLRARFNFRVRTPAGKELIAPTEIALNRDMTYNERDALAKELEEEALYRAMYSDISQQVLRRLAAIQTL